MVAIRLLNLDIGQLALGKPGRYLVAGFALSEFFGGGCMMLIVMWRIVMDMLPDQGTTLTLSPCYAPL